MEEHYVQTVKFGVTSSIVACRDSQKGIWLTSAQTKVKEPWNGVARVESYD